MISVSDYWIWKEDNFALLKCPSTMKSLWISFQFFYVIKLSEYIFFYYENQNGFFFLVNLYLVNNERGSRWFIKNLKSQSKIVVLLLRANFLLLVFSSTNFDPIFFMKFIFESKKKIKVSRWFFFWRIFCVGKINKGKWYLSRGRKSLKGFVKKWMKGLKLLG